LHVQSFELRLVCEEETTFRQGTDIRTERCCVFSETVFAESDFEIKPNRAFEHECDLRVPRNVMHSFRANHNAVQWMLVVRGRVKSWPEFTRSFPVIVYPNIGAEGSA